jgi:hypothetical protein
MVCVSPLRQVKRVQRLDMQQCTLCVAPVRAAAGKARAVARHVPVHAMLWASARQRQAERAVSRQIAAVHAAPRVCNQLHQCKTPVAVCRDAVAQLLCCCMLHAKPALFIMCMLFCTCRVPTLLLLCTAGPLGSL